MKRFTQNSIFRLIFWVIFPIAAFLATDFALAFLVKNFIQYGLGANLEITKLPIFQSVYSLFSFIALVWIFYFIPKKFFGQNNSRKNLGLQNPITLTDYAYGLIGLIVAMFIGGILLQFLAVVFPDFQIEQRQELGFSGLARPIDVALAFLTLTIAPSLAEEFIFRGVIYGNLREVSLSKKRKNNWILAMIITSVLFGLAHRQWNVAVVTFSMSVVMCFIREKLTDSIWAGVVLHFLKNSLAFFLLYAMPILRMINY